MTRIIRQLWSGNIDPVYNLGKNNAQLKRLERLIRQNAEGLEKHLNERGKDIFEKHHDCVNEYNTLLCEQAFCDGFCLGIKLVTEALNAEEYED